MGKLQFKLTLRQPILGFDEKLAREIVNGVQFFLYEPRNTFVKSRVNEEG